MHDLFKNKILSLISRKKKFCLKNEGSKIKFKKLKFYKVTREKYVIKKYLHYKIWYMLNFL